MDFEEFTNLLRKLGFSERISGSHHIFSWRDQKSSINVQPIGSKAKPYQVKQVREFLIKNKIAIYEP